MKTLRIPFIVLTAMILMAVLFGGTLLLAQDADPIATVDPNPFAIVTEEAGSPVTCQEGATCIVNEAPDKSEGNVTPANSIPMPVVIVGAVFVGLLFVVVLYNQQVVLKIVAKAIPMEDVPALFDALLPKVTDLVMNTVAKAIPGEIDDVLFIQAGKARGLTIVKDDVTGDYHSTRAPLPSAAARPSTPYPPASGTPLGTDLTASKTDTLPKRPASDGGAQGGGTGPFPPVQG